MAKTAEQELTELVNLVNNTDELKDSKVVIDTLNEIQSAMKTKKVDFGSLTPVFESLAKGIGIFTSPNSNDADIAVGVLNIVSSVFKAIGAIVPGGKVITTPMVIALKLVGGVLGTFGTSKASIYAKAINDIVTNALQELNSDQVNQNLKGAVEKMYEDHLLLADILSVEHADPKKLLSQFPDITVKSISDQAASELGAAYENLRDNVGEKHSKNWKKAAKTFKYIVQLSSFKTLYMLEGIAYFQLVEGAESEAVDSSTSTLTRMLDQLKHHYYELSMPYFDRPGIETAAITHWIYRFERSDFELVAMNAYCFSGGRGKYFELGPEAEVTVDFNCSVPTKHNPEFKSCRCMRLVTLYGDKDRKDKDKHGNLTGNKMLRVNDSEIIRLIISHLDPDPSRSHQSHFVMDVILPDGSYAAKDSNYPSAPYQNLAMRSRYIAQRGLTDTMTTFELWATNFYVFEVYPTAEEAANRKGKNSDKLWPNDWEHKLKDDRRLYMIGQQGSDDLIWCDHNASDFKQESFHTVVYDKKHYGSPEHCLWYFMEESEA